MMRWSRKIFFFGNYRVNTENIDNSWSNCSCWGKNTFNIQCTWTMNISRWSTRTTCWFDCRESSSDMNTHLNASTKGTISKTNSHAPVIFWNIALIFFHIPLYTVLRYLYNVSKYQEIHSKLGFLFFIILYNGNEYYWSLLMSL